MRFLGWVPPGNVSAKFAIGAVLIMGAAWGKFMEWKYPVEIVITSPTTFKTAGAVEVAASL